MQEINDRGIAHGPRPTTQIEGLFAPKCRSDAGGTQPSEGSDHLSGGPDARRPIPGRAESHGLRWVGLQCQSWALPIAIRTGWNRWPRAKWRPVDDGTKRRQHSRPLQKPLLPIDRTIHSHATRLDCVMHQGTLWS
ncbi:hypothetical protein, variant [Exophiala dermatitidis NIH/UT8656]|uniref:Uncharacterized protein n=1 Tax=Exophiala dermatitidis (strain ATCC 34100 / CBS 525.76 / NIH/UT8656) TaxID=858893 RepID=H6BME7_EXODN|nr:uncharacterized protein HMPREF1120_00249 [Exophiala dermatitidis NIH/UT8656]XP_009152491.1 hypothetical protein, variant [Exophiala dermatitidis NIH/UT8656]EHY52029.1 hypothetical protein, variant [Exophiala dermatitidis NIH/UT8656]EHY52030.1 hypothetical protein HMPREF1120_00249 [Exophiala dermatitidis NIH/UT8656]